MMKRPLYARVRNFALGVCMISLTLGVLNAFAENQTDGAKIVAEIPWAVWVFLSGVLVALGGNIQQLRQVRLDLKRQEGLREADAQQRKEDRDHFDRRMDENRQHFDARLDRHRARLEANELDIVRITERWGLKRLRRDSEPDPKGGA